MKLNKTRVSVSVPKSKGTDPNKVLDRALKRFNKLVDQEGILADYRNRRYFKKPCVARNEKSSKARLRAKKEREMQ